MVLRGASSTPDNAEVIVYQTTTLDNLSVYQGIITSSTWFFNDVLDAEKLRSSLCQLLSTGDWRKLGGRYRRGSHRKLELHVPVEFTCAQPAVTFNRDVYSINVEEHSMYSMLPQVSGKWSYSPYPTEMYPLTRHRDSPRTIDDIIKRDLPALDLFVSSFKNATIVTLTWPHSMMDIMGLNALLRAWTQVLANPAAPVPVFSGTKGDIAYESGGKRQEGDREEAATAVPKLSTVGMIIFGLYALWDALFGPRMASRTVTISKQVMKRLQQQAFAEATVETESKHAEKPWISEADALQALWIKTFSSSLRSSRPIGSICVFDTRGRLPFLRDRDAYYVQNLALGCWTTFSAADAEDKRVGQLALTIRQNLQRDTSVPQMLALLRESRRMWDAGKDPIMLYLPMNARLLVTTSWDRAKLFEVVDFAPAVISQGTPLKERANAAGKPFWYQAADALNDTFMHRNLVVTLGRDVHGNFVLVGNVSSRHWSLMQEALERV